MRAGIAFPHTHPHEAAHLRPLMRRLKDVAVLPAARPRVAVHATTNPPVRGAWNVQVFHGLGDKAYVLNPLFLQRGRFPRLRTAANLAAGAVGMRQRFLAPPREPGRRRARYEMMNAYGPRFRDAFERMLRGCEVGTYGHCALNDRPDVRPDPEGPVLWLPTWDNSRFLGGRPQTGLATHAEAVAAASREVPFTVKYHPLTVRHGQHADVRRRLESQPHVRVLDPATDAYDALRGARAVLTDTSSLGFEAYCLGFPVAVARPPEAPAQGMHAELEARVPLLAADGRAVADWAQDPQPPSDRAWADDLLVAPDARRNDAFARRLREALAP